MTDSSERADIGDIVAAFVDLRRQNTQVLQTLAEANGITRTDLHAVARLADSGGETPKSLGEFLGLTQGSMTALVDRVEAAGLLRREKHPTDRRSQVLRLTESGEVVASRSNAVYEKAFTRALRDDELPALHSAFQRVTEALRVTGGDFAG
jgi:DNA-binding MarR family transcriptional regulator